MKHPVLKRVIETVIGIVLGMLFLAILTLFMALALLAGLAGVG